MRRRLAIFALLLVTGGGGVVLAQPFTAQIQLALQTLGLWPYGIYADTEVPTWDAATQRFLPGTGGGGVVFPLAIPAATCAAPSLGLSGGATTGIAFTATPSILACIGGVAEGTWTAAGLVVDGNITANNPGGGVSAGGFILDAAVDNQRGFYFAAGGDNFRILSTALDATSIQALHNGTNRATGLLYAMPVFTVTDVATTDESRANIVFLSGDVDGQVITLVNNPVKVGTFWNALVTQTQTSNSLAIVASAGESIVEDGATCASLNATAVGAYVTVMTAVSGSGGTFAVTHNVGFTCTP